MSETNGWAATPGPWRHDGYGIYIWGADGSMVADGDPEAGYVSRMRGVGGGRTPQEQAANAKRIVSCVNACEPLPDPETAIPALMNLARVVNNDVNRGEPCPVCARAPHQDGCAIAALAHVQKGHP